MNSLEDSSHLPPLLIRHPYQTAIPLDKGVNDHSPISKLRPQGPTPGNNGSHDRRNPLIVEIARNQTPWLVERPGRGFEQIGNTLLAHRTIHPGIVIMS